MSSSQSVIEKMMPVLITLSFLPLVVTAVPTADDITIITVIMYRNISPLIEFLQVTAASVHDPASRRTTAIEQPMTNRFIVGNVFSAFLTILPSPPLSVLILFFLEIKKNRDSH